VAGALNAGADDRRAETRRRPHETPWLDVALLRPGQEVVVVNLSSHGALLESARRMRPGMRTELQLVGPRSRCVLPARVLRCVVAQLEPLRYRGALAFEEPLAVEPEGPGSG